MGAGKTIGSILGGAGAAALGLPPQIGTAVGGAIGGGIENKVSEKKGGDTGASAGGGAGGGMAQAGLSGAMGLLQNIQANKLQKKAEANIPQEIAARQAGYLSELAQKRKAIDTGADFAAGMDAINTGQAGTNAALVKATGGDVGGTVQALLQAQRGADTAKGNVLAQGQQQRMGYDTMYGDLLNKISARQLQLQMYKTQQARAEWAQKKQTANQNTMAGLAGASGMIGGMGGGGGTPDVSSTAGMDPSMSYLGATSSNITNPNPANNITMDPNQTKDMPVTSGSNLLGEGLDLSVLTKK